MTKKHLSIKWFSWDSFDLFTISFLLLFFELTIIRWVPATIRVVAYFSNVILISCFLGTGVGCIYGKRRSLMLYFPWLVLFLLFFCQYLGKRGIDNPKSAVEYFFGGGGQYSWIIVVPFIFIINALPFICIGQKLFEALTPFTPLRGYSINILGSLAGTLLFAVFSFIGLSPLTWFLTCFVAMTAIARKHRLGLGLAMLAIIASGWLVSVMQKPFLWSPYYKIYVERIENDIGTLYGVTVNDDYHQLILDLRAESKGVSVSRDAWRETYDFPYLYYNRTRPLDVLVLGAGTGNDVAAALRNGAVRVDAVELDPVIVALGRKLNSEKPYDNPRVRVIVNDARAFIDSATHKYDLIILGWLDSHRLFSSLSNVRQDNFVYSIESMQQARKLLKDDGILVLSFYVERDWLGAKIYRMLTRAFSHTPDVYARSTGGYGPKGAIFVVPAFSLPARPALPQAFTNITSHFSQIPDSPPPTDSWPYLYYRDRHISTEYLLIMVILLSISSCMIAPGLRWKSLQPREAVHFFMLGAAFLLLEVRNITSLALVFGSTWLVTSIVISAILLTILLANAFVAKGFASSSPWITWLLLFCSIFLSLVWSQFARTLSNQLIRSVFTTSLVSITFVFTGIIFASSFARTSIPGTALGFNILGAVAGGLTEYASLVLGIDGLSLIALLFYIAAYFARPRDGGQS